MNAYQQPTQPDYAAPQQKTNVLAIVTLVTGLLGICLIPLALGFVSLNQIKKTGDKGRGMAITGMVATVVWTVIGIIVGVVSAASSSETAESLGLLANTLY